MSDKAQALIDELISAAIAFGRGVAPDWQTRIEKAQRELRAYIEGLEADNKKALDLVRKLRMYCIWAKWDNPDTEDEFSEFDEEVCEYLSEYKVCIDQLTVHSDIERQDDKSPNDTQTDAVVYGKESEE